MSRGAPPSNPTGPRGSSKGGSSSNRGAPPPDDMSPRGTSSGGGNPLRPADVSGDPNGFGPLPPDKVQAKQDPFNMSLTSLIETRKPTGMTTQTVDSAGFHLTLPMLDVGQKQSAQDLINSLYSMKSGDLKKLQQQLVDAGYLAAHDSGGTGLVTGFADKATVTAYELMLEDIYRYQQNPDTKDMTIDDLLKQRAQAYKAGGGGTTTKTTITQFSPVQAQGFLQGAYEKYLGRRASQAEVQAFASSLNAYSQANPTTTTQTIDQSGNKIAEKDSPSIDPATLAENDTLQNNPVEAKGYAGDNALMAIMSHLGLPQ